MKHRGAEAYVVGAWRVLPWPKPEVVEGIDAVFRPILIREGLSIPDKPYDGLTT